MKAGKVVGLLFIGMLIGIILFVGVIAGVVFAVGSSMTVGEVQGMIGIDIIDQNSDIYNQTLVDLLGTIIGDVSNPSALSLATLGDKYGIKFLKQIEGIDLTSKPFYSMPIGDVLANPSMIVESITLNEVGSLANIDFSEYGLPILNDNLDNGITMAIDNLMKSIDGEKLSIRSIKDTLGIDLGVGDNAMLASLQDINLSSFGEVINVLQLNTLLEADTDMFVPYGKNIVYVKTDLYQAVDSDDLKNGNAEVGVETYIAGAKGDIVDLKELRYVKKEVNGIDTYVVDNSCYAPDFDIATNDKTFYRHVEYAPFATHGTAASELDLFVYSYANRIETFDNNTFNLKSGEFVSLSTIYRSNDKNDSFTKAIFENHESVLDANGCVNLVNFYVEDGTLDTPALITEGAYSITDSPITKDSLLHLLKEDTSRTKYVRVHIGTSMPVLKAVAHLSVTELQNADDLLNSLTIGDIVVINENTSSLIVALKDSTLKTIGEDVNDLTFGEIMDIDDESSSLMKALKDSTLDTVEEDMKTLTLGDIMDVNDDSSTLMQSLKDSTLETIDEDINKLTIDQIIDVEKDDTSAIMKSLAKRGCTIEDLGTIANDLSIGEVLVIDYDEFVVDENGFYVKQDLFVPYNEYVHEGYDFYKFDGTSYTLAEPEYIGEKFVNVGRYSVYDDTLHAGMTRYSLSKAGSTSKALQSLALRGTPLNELGSAMDTLFVDELLAIDTSSSLVMKSLSKKSVTMDEFDTCIDTLKIDEVIEIDDNSSHIMKSLAARDCKISELGTVMDDMRIDEVIEIDSSSSLIMQSLKTRGTKINELGTVMDDLRIDEIIDVTSPDTSIIMKSLANRGCTINELGSVADKLTLGEMMDIYANHYVVDSNGIYVMIVDNTLAVPYNSQFEYMNAMTRVDADLTLNADGDYVYSHYFTLFNPAVHAEDMTRYSIANPAGYTPSSKILQRFAFTTLKADSFDSLILSDVMDIEADVYMKVAPEYATAHPEVDYYVYDSTSNVYIHWDGVETAQLYMVKIEGNGHTIIKRIAFCKVNELGSAMETVMNSTRINELVDINTYNAISISDDAPIASEEARYFIRPVGVDENGRPYTYVYDGTGKFMIRDYRLDETSVDNLTSVGTLYYKYVQLTSALEVAAHVTDQNVFYKSSDTEYVYNLPLSAYLATQNPFPTGKLYTRVACSASDAGAIAAPIYQNLGNLYVDIAGAYIPYDSNNLTHLSKDSYFVKVDEMSIVSITQRGVTNIVGGIPVYDESYDYVDDIKLAKRYCDNVYIKDVAGDFVYINGKYIGYDENLHAGAQRYRMEIGYLASFSESYHIAGDEFVTELTLVTVTEVEREQSVPVLRYFALKNSTVSDMNTVIEDATISDLMDIDPNSIFAKFQDKKMSELNSAFSTAFSTFTVGELVEWASITDIDEKVIDAVGGVTLENFFKALKFSSTSGIYIDMEVALGYK